MHESLLARTASLERPRERYRSRIGPLLIACLLLASPPAYADLTRTDVQVAVRALSFVSDPLAGTVQVGIVYSERSRKSKQQAESLESILGDGLRIGALELRPVMVELGDVRKAEVDLFFLTEHIAPGDTASLAEAARARTVCITTDLDQVRGGTCAIGVRSRPKVEVFVSRAAAAASDITFSTVFRVMITEL